MLPKQGIIFLSFSMIKHWKTERQSHHSILHQHLEDLDLTHRQLKTALQCRNKVSALLERGEIWNSSSPTGLIVTVVWLRNSLIPNIPKFTMPDGSRVCKHQVGTIRKKNPIDCNSSLYPFKFCSNNNSKWYSDCKWVLCRARNWVKHYGFKIPLYYHDKSKASKYVKGELHMSPDFAPSPFFNKVKPTW